MSVTVDSECGVGQRYYQDVGGKIQKCEKLEIIMVKSSVLETSQYF